MAAHMKYLRITYQRFLSSSTQTTTSSVVRTAPLCSCSSNNLYTGRKPIHLRLNAAESTSFNLTQTRGVRSQPKRKGFLEKVYDNLKHGLEKDKEVQKNIKKFREETKKLEQSDALLKARKKYEDAGSSAVHMKKRIGDLGEKIQEEAQKSEWLKKSKDFTEEVGKAAKDAADTVSKHSEQISQTQAFKTISKSVEAVKKEIDETTSEKIHTYQAPEILKKRSESQVSMEEKPIEPNEEATGIQLHKDSRWYQQWQNFKDNNSVVHKFFDLKTKYDESDNVAIRATRFVTDRVGSVFGGMFSKSEMSEVLTEIIKVDPSFSKEKFLKQCETEIIPNIMEAMMRGDLAVLQDWCYEATYNVLATPLKQVKTRGLIMENKVLDIEELDILMGKMMEQGPVLIISFQSNQIMAVRDTKGTVVEGNPDQVLNVRYVWALCRDQDIFDPRAAWRLLDISAETRNQWI